MNNNLNEQNKGEYRIDSNGDIVVSIRIPIERLCEKKYKQNLYKSVDLYLDMLNKIQVDIGLHPDKFDPRNKE